MVHAQLFVAPQVINPSVKFPVTIDTVPLEVPVPQVSIYQVCTHIVSSTGPRTSLVHPRVTQRPSLWSVLMKVVTPMVTTEVKYGR